MNTSDVQPAIDSHPWTNTTPGFTCLTKSRKRISARMIAAAKLLRSYGASRQKPISRSIVERYHRIGPKSLPYLLECGLVIADEIERIDGLSPRTLTILLAFSALKTRDQVLSALQAGTLAWVETGNIRGIYFKDMRIKGIGCGRFRELCAWTGFNNTANPPRF